MIRQVEIEPEALAAILEHDGHSFVPLPRDLRLKARMQISAAVRSVNSEDTNSKAFRTRLTRLASILTDDARIALDNIAIVFVDSPLPHASLASVGDERVIVVCRGLFDLVHFRTALSTICSKLAAAGDQVPMIDELEPGDAMMLAGQVALFDAYANLRGPGSVADALGQDDAQNLEFGVSTSLLLLVLHELGHEALGHSERVCVVKGVDVISVAREVPLPSRKKLEFDADAYSVAALLPEWRPQMLASVISLMDIFQFLETFGVRPSQEYPPASDRLTKMVDHMNLSKVDGLFARSWLDDYEQRRSLIDAATTDPEVVSKQFEGVMDISTAYKVMYHLREQYLRLGL